MPRKAEFNPQRKQDLADTLRAATAAAWHARQSVRYHFRMDDALYEEADDIYKRVRALETRAQKRLQLPTPTNAGFPTYAIRPDGTLPI